MINIVEKTKYYSSVEGTHEQQKISHDLYRM